MNKLVGATEMGRILGGLHACTVLRWAEKGFIPSVMVGRYRRFEPEEVMIVFKDGSFRRAREKIAKRGSRAK